MNRVKRIVPSAAKRLKIYLNHHKEPLYRKWYYQHSNRLSKFKNIHAGKDCFIIGNGPSLNQMDLSLLNDYHTFGLNKIYYLFDNVDLDLSYYVAVNRFVIEQSIKQIEALKCPSFLSFTAASELVNHHEHIYYIYTGGPYTFRTDITSKIREGHTVTFVAMQIAYYMGFNRVFLIGVDHNFVATGKPNEKQVLHGDDFNHFDARYFRGQEWELPNLDGSELSYQLAKYFFNQDGRKIYDATYDGKLNVFNKIDYIDALKISKNKSKEKVDEPT